MEVEESKCGYIYVAYPNVLSRRPQDFTTIIECVAIEDLKCYLYVAMEHGLVSYDLLQEFREKLCLNI